MREVYIENVISDNEWKWGSCDAIDRASQDPEGGNTQAWEKCATGKGNTEYGIFEKYSDESECIIIHAILLELLTASINCIGIWYFWLK